MKIFAISDLHISSDGTKPMEVFGKKWDGYLDKIKADWQEKVGQDDIVLIAGDLSWAMQLEGAVKDLQTIVPLNGKKIIIKGNHDYWWSAIGRVRSSLGEGFYALQNDSVKIGNYVFCGSRGWTLENPSSEQDQKLVLREVERFRLALKDAEKKREEGDKLICLIHYPPFDLNRNSSPFTELFEQYKADAVVYGHLHGKDCKAELLVDKNGIKYYLTSCDLVSQKLTLIEV